jgi:hypothetical protein
VPQRFVLFKKHAKTAQQKNGYTLYRKGLRAFFKRLKIGL